MVATTESYFNATTAAKQLGCSRSSVCRAAKNYGVGIFANGRLSALSKEDVDAIKNYIHDEPGNPLWIAARGRKITKARKRKRSS